MSQRFRFGLLTCLVLLATAAVVAAQEPILVPDWRDLSEPPFPLFDVLGNGNPVLTAADVTDAAATFLADPFLFHEGERWYVFFETSRLPPLSPAIAVATSDDGVTWDYDRIVLQAPGQHFSYPYVFKWDGSYYLLPNILEVAGVRLFKADAAEFPYQWTAVADLLGGWRLADASVFRHAGLWWMFASNTDSYTCYLFYSGELENPAAWTEHPASPIVADDRMRARPGGRVVVLAEDRIFRPAQKCWPVYGECLRLFEVTELTTEHYAEEEIPESPILVPSGSGWNGERMHHCDPWWTGDRWLASVDGRDGAHWSLGIYMSEVQTEVLSPPPARNLNLSCRPNPFNPATTFDFALPKPSLARLTIYDLEGRLLAVLCHEPLSAGPHSVTWDASNSRGRAPASGLYLACLEACEVQARIKLLLLK